MTVSPIWTATLSDGEHSLVSFFLVFALLALFAGFLRSAVTRSEVGARYTTAMTARLALTAVAASSYIFIAVRFFSGYEQVHGSWVPNPAAMDTFAFRYVDWAITVPLLTVELLAVTTLSGSALRKTRAAAIAGSFCMIFAGYLGFAVVGDGRSRTALITFGLISVVFWIATNVILVRAVRQSLTKLTVESASILRNATIVLLGGWVIYPVVYLIAIFGAGGGWATTMQVALCVADVAVKVIFGGLTHRVAKLRTAEDVRTGTDIHPEAVWISSEKQSDAGAPRLVYLANESLVHQRRERPSDTIAIATESEPEDFTIE